MYIYQKNPVRNTFVAKESAVAFLGYFPLFVVIVVVLFGDKVVK
jgi:hypothetical protein